MSRRFRLRVGWCYVRWTWYGKTHNTSHLWIATFDHAKLRAKRDQRVTP